MARRLPVVAVAASLVANWVASENITGLTGVVACQRAVPSILMDPLGAALCLALLGVLVAPFAGRYSTLSEIVVVQYGVIVGGLASILSLVESLLWAGAQYKAVLSIVEDAAILPQAALEPFVLALLLVWTLMGGLVADVWLDLLSMMVVAPSIMALAVIALANTPAAAWEAEVAQARQVLPSRHAANMLAVGVLGNLFTEELAGRVLLAGSPTRARVACFAAALLFAVMGLAPAVVGVWAGSMVGVVGVGPSASTGGDAAENLCDGGQDRIISIAVRQLIPTWLRGTDGMLGIILIVESLNTVDTSILMCAQVVATQAVRAVPSLRAGDGSGQHGGADDVEDKTTPPAWLTTATVVAVLSLVAGTSKLGDSVWEVGESATAAVGAPLGLLCVFLAWPAGGPPAALAGAVVAQGVYSVLGWWSTAAAAATAAASEVPAAATSEASPSATAGEATGMPFVWATAAGAVTYVVVAASVTAARKRSPPC